MGGSQFALFAAKGGSQFAHKLVRHPVLVGIARPAPAALPFKFLGRYQPVEGALDAPAACPQLPRHASDAGKSFAALAIEIAAQLARHP